MFEWMSSIELIATIAGIIAVTLQVKEKIIAWPFAILSVGLASVIYFNSKLYSDFGLHLIYIILNIYGWYIWSNKNGNTNVAITKRLNLNGVITSLAVVGIGTVALGFLMFKQTDASLPFFDAFTTSGSLVAQYLLSKKYLQNWLLWILVDLIAIPMYLYKGLYFFSFLFLVYLVLCVWGYVSWKKELNSNDTDMVL